MSQQPDTNEFADRLRAQRARRQQDVTRSRTMVILNEFCAGVVEFSGERLLCFLDPGFSVNMGQEWKVVLKSKVTGSLHVLIRAYVAQQTKDGFPVTLNRYDDKLVKCADETTLRARLNEFIDDPSVTEIIDLLAVQPASRA